MNVAHVHTFLAVLQAGSYAAAAPLVFLETGSAVSKQVKHLGRHYGVALVENISGRLALTTEGETLLPHLQAIALADNAAKALSSELRSGSRAATGS